MSTPNTWRCTRDHCPTAGHWQIAPADRSPEQAWTAHMATVHGVVPIDPDDLPDRDDDGPDAA